MCIDRAAVVRRHNPRNLRPAQPEPFTCLSVGNGQFVFTADVTGLQTFAEAVADRCPLCTASHWGWHTTPPGAGVHPEAIRYQLYEAHGRQVPYLTLKAGQEATYDWLRQNPHRMHLGRVFFPDVRFEELGDVDQQLDLYTGILHSRFTLRGRPVSVTTCCHPELDMIAVRVESPLMATGPLPVALAFGYGAPQMSMVAWDQPKRHVTAVERAGSRLDFHRTLDQDQYHVALVWEGEAAFELVEAHRFQLTAKGEALSFVCAFSPQKITERLPGVDATQDACAASWQAFWDSGGAVTFDGSTDPWAQELERRVVLSQYLTAIHSSGGLPSPETGLLCNSWYGKFHLEMHWWHSVHFAVWNRFEHFARTLAIYHRMLEPARQNARRQGYAGARWPKMVGPDGRDSPSPIGPLLIWQQPHPIYYAELCYRHEPTRRTLDRWAPIVFGTADFMASYAAFEPDVRRYALGPPLAVVSENQPHETARNPTFELTYWRFGLRLAGKWRRRMDLEPDPQWQRVRDQLAPAPTHDGLYLLQEGLTDTYTRWNWEHPALTGALGMLPGQADGIDPAIMAASVRRVMETWQWRRKSWGWDFPMVAMCAARTGQPELAVDALLLEAPKNQYTPNGHNYQRPDLPAYLPGNGGLLAAVAMMCAGWSRGPEAPAPGFPSRTWKVTHENLRAWL